MSFEQILEFVRSQNEFIIYGVLFLSAYIENIIPPFPGDAVMLSGAFLAGKGDITYIGVLLSVTSGGVIGAMTVYYIGRVGGRRFFEIGRGRHIIKGNLTKVDSLFQKYGEVVVLASRFLAGVRPLIAVSAGIARFPAAKMWIFGTIGFLLWYGILTGLMIYSKSNWELIVDLVKRYNIALLVIGALVLIGWLAWSLWIKRNSK